MQGVFPPSDDPVQVVTIGETMALVAPTAPGPLEDAVTLTMGVGGAESNVAMYLAGLGHRVRWVSRLGDDPMGRSVLREVSAAGVDTSAVSIDGTARTGVYFKDPLPGGTEVHYYRDRSAASRMTPDVLDDPLLYGAQVVHVSGVTAALSTSCRDLVRAVVAGRALGPGLVSFDVNYRSALWPVDDAAPVLAEVADLSDIVLVGLDEARTLWGCETPQDVRRLLPRPATVVVKDGAVGAHCLEPERTTSVPAPYVDVVEAVGAGDAFAAGFLSAMLRGADAERGLRQGHLVAARALSVIGDQADLPIRAWFDEHLDASAEAWSRLHLGAAAS